jgi:hypothetical protein
MPRGEGDRPRSTPGRGPWSLLPRKCDSRLIGLAGWVRAARGGICASLPESPDARSAPHRAFASARGVVDVIGRGKVAGEAGPVGADRGGAVVAEDAGRFGHGDQIIGVTAEVQMAGLAARGSAAGVVPAQGLFFVEIQGSPHRGRSPRPEDGRCRRAGNTANPARPRTVHTAATARRE